VSKEGATWRAVDVTSIAGAPSTEASHAGATIDSGNSIMQDLQWLQCHPLSLIDAASIWVHRDETYTAGVGQGHAIGHTTGDLNTGLQGLSDGLATAQPLCS
jgi:hypothetical protein